MPPPPPHPHLWSWDIAGENTAGSVDCDTGAVSETRFQGFWPPRAAQKRNSKHTHLSHVEQKTNIGESPLITHAHSYSGAAAGVGHRELIATDGNVNSKYDNTRDREDDVGAGGGASDEAIKLSRCVFAAQMIYV